MRGVGFRLRDRRATAAREAPPPLSATSRSRCSCCSSRDPARPVVRELGRASTAHERGPAATRSRSRSGSTRPLEPTTSPVQRARGLQALADRYQRQTRVAASSSSTRTGPQRRRLGPHEPAAAPTSRRRPEIAATALAGPRRAARWTSQRSAATTCSTSRVPVGSRGRHPVARCASRTSAVGRSTTRSGTSGCCSARCAGSCSASCSS